MQRIATFLALGIGLVGLLALAIAILPAPARDSIASRPPTAVSPTGVAAASPSAAPSPTPLAIRSTAPVGTGSGDAVAMLRAHNELRAAIGAPLTRGDERVTAAAQRHAEYLARNAAGGHEESPGQPGFTGVSTRDRLIAQGYPATTASEVATSVGPAMESVRSLWVLPYHRLGLMHPHAIVAGWGYAEIDGRRAAVGVLVYDFASAAPDLVRSPATGQRVAASWDGQEFPDVLPAGAPRPVGFPVMLMASRARAVDLRGARITGPNGELVPHHVVPQIYERDYVAIVPVRPLVPGARYRVRLELTIAGADVVDEWEFETER